MVFAMAQFGEMLAELRQDRGMSQKELAKKLYVTVGTISNYEHGVHLPDVEKLIIIADFFNVSTDYLLGRCSSSASPDVLNQKLISDKSAGCVIQEIRKLSPERRQAISVILADMNVSMIIGELGK